MSCTLVKITDLIMTNRASVFNCSHVYSHICVHDNCCSPADDYDAVHYANSNKCFFIVFNVAFHLCNFCVGMSPYISKYVIRLLRGIVNIEKSM